MSDLAKFWDNLPENLKKKLINLITVSEKFTSEGNKKIF